MSSLYIRLSKAAIKAKLTQNESLIFHALMVQTLGYRKTNDNLTDKRLAQLSGIRLDHFRVALESFLQRDLFYRIEHPRYDYQYRICDEFLDAEETTIVYPPSLPKSGQAREVRGNLPEVGADSPQTLVDLPELGGHTTENLNIKKPQQTNQTEKNLLQKKQQTKHKKPKKNKKQTKQTKHKKPKKNKKQKQPTASLLISFGETDTLPEQMVIESSQPIRLEISANQRAKATTVTEETTEQNNAITEPVIEKNVDTQPIVAPTIEPTETPDSEPIIEKPIAPPPVAEPSIEPTPIADTEPVSEPITEPMPTIEMDSEQVEIATEFIEKQEPAKAQNLLPKVIGKADVQDCQRQFDLLNDQQQKDVLTVFDQQLKKGTIKSKSRYFIGLARKAQAGGLTVVKESNASNTPPAYSPEAFALAKEQDKEREQRAVLWSDYRWLQQQAALQNKTEQQLSIEAGMEEAYALFSTLEDNMAQVA